LKTRRSVATKSAVSRKRRARLERAKRLVGHIYFLTGGHGPAWEELVTFLVGVLARAAIDRERKAPRPRREDEAWLRHQLDTLDTDDEEEDD
jgi:hypothetical protein